MRAHGNRSVIRQLWPLLAVSDIDHSVEFYRDRMGFTIVGRAESGERLFWCRLERDGGSIMLEQDETARGSRGYRLSFYFVCDDVDDLYREHTDRGLALEPPVVAYYGMKHLSVPEPDGHSIHFESPTEGRSG